MGINNKKFKLSMMSRYGHLCGVSDGKKEYTSNEVVDKLNELNDDMDMYRQGIKNNESVIYDLKNEIKEHRKKVQELSEEGTYIQVVLDEDDPYTLKLKGQIRPVKIIRVRGYSQGTLTDKEWEEFKEILHEAVEELRQIEYDETEYTNPEEC